MRTTARSLTGTALTAVCLGALAASPAYAGDFERLELNPSVATPGTLVTASTRACGPDGRGVGDAQSLGAGDFKLRPSDHKNLAVGQFKVPERTKPGTFTIAVACDNGKTATGELTVKDDGRRHDGGRHEDERRHDGGRHDDDRRHDSQMPDHPRGPVKTGVGGSVGPDATRIAAGVAVLLAAAGGGMWLLRRRANDS